MGHKVHPKIFRIGTIYGWDSKWFATKRTYPALLREDVKIKAFLRAKLKEASVDRIEIERGPHAMVVTVHSAKPGFIIGRAGAGAEDLKKQLFEILAGGKPDASGKKQKFNLSLNIMEVSRPSLSATIVAASVVAELERRLPFRRILKQTVDRVQKAGAKGVKVMVSGRLNGAEIARREMLSWGSVPLQNLRADIDFATDTARMLYGTIGVKVWIYRGDIFEKDSKNAAEGREPGRTAKAAPAKA